ncbi:MAG TPA: histidine phosphatase family protein [Trebonia sp.]
MSTNGMSTSSLPGTDPTPGLAAQHPHRRTHPTLWLIRHGESTWNIAGLAQGHNDEAELTERGLRQAAEAAAQFGYRPVRALYASDLRRAQQTAAAFAAVLGLPVHADKRLRERSLGVLEGNEHKTISPSVTGLADGLVIDPDARPPAGESVRDLYLRAATFCDDLAEGLLEDRDTLPGLTQSDGDVLVIAHGGTVRVLDAYIHGVTVDQMTWPPVDNATTVRIPAFGQQSRGGKR